MIKVGDEVLVKGKVIDDDGRGGKQFRITGVDGFPDVWFTEEELIPADKTYEMGLKDAWELARKVYYMPEEDYKEIFDTCFMDVILKSPVEEALAKIEAYEREKEIKPTDVVEYDGKNWVVTEVYKGEYSIWNGKKVIHTANVKKIGNAESIEPLAELLRQIGE